MLTNLNLEPQYLPFCHCESRVYALSQGQPSSFVHWIPPGSSLYYTINFLRKEIIIIISLPTCYKISHLKIKQVYNYILPSSDQYFPEECKFSKQLSILSLLLLLPLSLNSTSIRLSSTENTVKVTNDLHNDKSNNHFSMFL